VCSGLSPIERHMIVRPAVISLHTAYTMISQICRVERLSRGYQVALQRAIYTRKVQSLLQRHAEYSMPG
jgi:hypothetical protein